MQHLKQKIKMNKMLKQLPLSKQKHLQLPLIIKLSFLNLPQLKNNPKKHQLKQTYQSHNLLPNQINYKKHNMFLQTADH